MAQGNLRSYPWEGWEALLQRGHVPPLVCQF